MVIVPFATSRRCGDKDEITAKSISFHDNERCTNKRLRVLARVAVTQALVQIRGGLEVGASGEILVDHRLSSAKSFVLYGFDVAFVGVNTHNIVLALLLENKSGANAKSADAQHSYVVLRESHRDKTSSINRCECS